MLTIYMGRPVTIIAREEGRRRIEDKRIEGQKSDVLMAILRLVATLYKSKASTCWMINPPNIPSVSSSKEATTGAVQPTSS